MLPHPLLNPSNGATWTLPRPGIRVRTLATYGKAAPVADTLVGSNINLALNVLRDFSTQVTLDLEIRINVVAQEFHLLIGEITDPRGGINPYSGERLRRTGAPNPVDICQADLRSLVSGKIDTGDSRHYITSTP
jgi:hypothetical protein